MPPKRILRTPSPQVDIPSTPFSQKLLHSRARSASAKKRPFEFPTTPTRRSSRIMNKQTSMMTPGTANIKRKRTSTSSPVSPITGRKQLDGTGDGKDDAHNLSIILQQYKKTKVSASTVVQFEDTDTDDDDLPGPFRPEDNELPPPTPMAITPAKRGRPRKSKQAASTTIAKENKPLTSTEPTSRFHDLQSLLDGYDLDLDAATAAKAIVHYLHLINKGRIRREIFELTGLTTKEKMLALMVATICSDGKDLEKAMDDIDHFFGEQD
ncbi:hypothetical protein ABW21_db0203912 [Orbilia brochopaga]|nr:hypothetical protein ABW21_db0203912 [Drechslerella brochopaga]